MQLQFPPFVGETVILKFLLSYFREAGHCDW